MNTAITILSYILVGLIGICIGIIISNFNHNRFLIKHGISPKKLDKAIDCDELNKEFDKDIDIMLN